MAISRPLDLTNEYKQNIYNICLDMSGWDRTTIQAIAPLAGPISIYGTNDGGGRQSVTDGNAELAINFTPIQATNLATGTAGTTIAAAGNYKIDINTKYIRLAGGGADVYRLYANHTKGI
jgi:hypothetical protein